VGSGPDRIGNDRAAPQSKKYGRNAQFFTNEVQARRALLRNRASLVESLPIFFLKENFLLTSPGVRIKIGSSSYDNPT
jgi:hypothetical protein